VGCLFEFGAKRRRILVCTHRVVLGIGALVALRVGGAVHERGWQE
jgi:hypothetical protein